MATTNQIRLYEINESNQRQREQLAATMDMERKKLRETSRNNRVQAGISTAQLRDSAMRWRSELSETTRTNLAKERETNRSNMVREALTKQSNEEVVRSNQAREKMSLLQHRETVRSNVAKETENIRSHMAQEGLQSTKQANDYYLGILQHNDRLQSDATQRYNINAQVQMSNDRLYQQRLEHEEQVRANKAKEQETKRKNVADQSLNVLKHQEEVRHNKAQESSNRIGTAASASNGFLGSIIKGAGTLLGYGGY